MQSVSLLHIEVLVTAWAFLSCFGKKGSKEADLGCAPERCRWQIQRGGKQVQRSVGHEPALTGDVDTGHRKRKGEQTLSCCGTRSLPWR